MKLIVPEAIWRKTWAGLRKRGDGSRESACVWAGRRTTTTEIAEAVYFLDDLNGTEARSLRHCTPRTATAELFRMLSDRGLLIVADVHTHPSSWVDLSEVDQAHPIEYRPGLLALVIPHYAQSEPALSSVGAHVYRGDGEWARLTLSQMAARLEIGGERK